jgi:hypothetical protein
MNNKQIAIIALIAVMTGASVGAYLSKDSHSVQIHKTGSGMFIIDKGMKGDERIYQVLELPTNVPSFVAPRGDF